MNHIQMQEDSNFAACYNAASMNNINPKEADNCDNGSLCCPNCPWKSNKCLKCGETMDHFQRDGDMLAPEADWYVCPECGYQTDPE